MLGIRPTIEVCIRVPPPLTPARTDMPRSLCPGQEDSGGRGSADESPMTELPTSVTRDRCTSVQCPAYGWLTASVTLRTLTIWRICSTRRLYERDGFLVPTGRGLLLKFRAWRS